MKQMAVSAKNIAVNYYEYTREKVISFGRVREIEAVKNATFQIKNGERVAIIGRNGSGKSTLLKTMAGLLRPAKGILETKGRILYLSGVDPGFDWELSGRENIRQLAIAYGIPGDKLDSFISSVEDFSGLDEAFDRKYGGYSSGMRGKIGFGFISDLRSDVLLIDETFGAGDREFRIKSRAKMNAMIEEISTVVMVTHGMDLARNICERGLVMDAGELVFDGPIIEAIEFYKKLSSESINWIEFKKSNKKVTEDGLNFNFVEEFGVNEDIRIVIHDQIKKEFILIEEIESGKNIRIPLSLLPRHMNCKFKIQQLRDDLWVDASRYIQLIKNED